MVLAELCIEAQLAMAGQVYMVAEARAQILVAGMAHTMAAAELEQQQLNI
jgi:NaMN:DMB phosphoribosyltransferase